MVDLYPRAVYDETPPEPRSREANHPTLLFSWWCTCFSLVIILFRLSGRFVRTERLFREDKVMALSIIPLFARMAFVHVILLYGTNNVDAAALFDERRIRQHEIGARLVLCSRIFYAGFIWTAKLGVCEFLARMVKSLWRREYDLIIKFVRLFLLATFIAVVIAALAECHPFSHYWQVIPDPGPQCRLGYAHLITMGVCDVMTDILLIAFPIPMVVRSTLPMKKKFRLVLVFSLSSILIAITATRVPEVIEHRGRQQYRTVFASGEILGAAAVSNAMVLGSFLRDRGVKKQKYKWNSSTDTTDRASSRRPTLTTVQWGSDEDLIRDGVAWRLAPDMEGQTKFPRPAPVALPADTSYADPKLSFIGGDWHFPDAASSSKRTSDDDIAVAPHDAIHARQQPNKPSVSFFDIGGLLDVVATPPSTARAPSSSQTSSILTRTHDFAAPPRRGSRALLSDLGGFKIGLGHRSSQQGSLQEGDSFELTPRNVSPAVNAPPSIVEGCDGEGDVGAAHINGVCGARSASRSSDVSSLHRKAPTSEDGSAPR
ncbi:putative integral membrane protein [Phyllosticta citribraziliensis]|uniref:Integral membrane protein n=1 Tax=Phyllosticta citribraziliensis TaxID=989973 RepID=A0ABR1M0B1_9PEZI